MCAPHRRQAGLADAGHAGHSYAPDAAGRMAAAAAGNVRARAPPPPPVVPAGRRCRRSAVGCVFLARHLVCARACGGAATLPVRSGAVRPYLPRLTGAACCCLRLPCYYVVTSPASNLNAPPPTFRAVPKERKRPGAFMATNANGTLVPVTPRDPTPLTPIQTWKKLNPTVCGGRCVRWAHVAHVAHTDVRMAYANERGRVCGRVCAASSLARITPSRLPSSLPPPPPLSLLSSCATASRAPTFTLLKKNALLLGPMSDAWPALARAHLRLAGASPTGAAGGAATAP